MLKVLIPAAGRGSRFRDAGYTVPKPFLSVHGLPMIQWVVDMFPRHLPKHILIQKDDWLYAEAPFWQSRPDVNFHYIEYQTTGAAVSVDELCQKAKVDCHEDSFMVCNSDNVFKDRNAIESFIWNHLYSNYDGQILTFEDSTRDPKWSYVRTGVSRDSRHVLEVAEKRAISTIATAGLYYFRNYSSFKLSLQRMMGEGDVVNGEYYLCPVYNHMIALGGLVTTVPLKDGMMIGLGTPEEYKNENEFQRLLAYDPKMDYNR